MKECVTCGALFIKEICDECFGKMGNIVKGTINNQYNYLSLYEYRKIDIRAVKYGRKDNLIKALVKRRINEIQEWIGEEDVELIYVPNSKIMDRGYNVGLIIATEIVDAIGGKLRECTLIELKRGEKNKDKNERMEKTIVGKMEVISNAVIIDDVICSGGTMEKMINIIKKHGSLVRCLSLVKK